MPAKKREQVERRIRLLKQVGMSSPGIRALKGKAHPIRYRLRVGDYRVIFTCESRVITILQIVDRKDAYRDL